MLNPPRRHSRTRNRCTAKASARTNQQQTAAVAKAITVTDGTVFKHLMERNPKILKRIFELTFNISIADLKQLNAEEFLPVWPDSDGCVPSILVRDNQNRHYYVWIMT